jgi:hypothetical protein
MHFHVLAIGVPRLRPFWGLKADELESYRRISKAIKGGFT